MLNVIKRLWTEEEGQGMAEYGLILALVAIACVAAFQFLTDGIDGLLRDVGGELGATE